MTILQELATSPEPRQIRCALTRGHRQLQCVVRYIPQQCGPKRPEGQSRHGSTIPMEPKLPRSACQCSTNAPPEFQLNRIVWWFSQTGTLKSISPPECTRDNCYLTSNAFLKPFPLSYRGEIAVLEWDKSDRSQWIPMRYCILYNLIFGGDHQNDAMRPKISFLFSKVFFQKNMFLNLMLIWWMWGIPLKLGERKGIP